MKVSVVVNYFNPKRSGYLRQTAFFALASLRESAEGDCEVLLADGSGQVCDAMADHCREEGAVYLPVGAPESFAQTYNRGAAAATGNVLVLCASDIFVAPGWIEGVAQHLERTGAAMVCPYLSYSDYAAQCSSAVARRNPFAPCAMTINLNAIRRDVWNQVGSLDTSFSGNYNDVDYLIRLRRAGQSAVVADCGAITHLGSATLRVSTLVDAGKDSETFRSKHGEFAYAGFWHKCWHPLLCRSRVFGAILRTSAQLVPASKRYAALSAVLRFEPLFNRV